MSDHTNNAQQPGGPPIQDPHGRTKTDTDAKTHHSILFAQGRLAYLTEAVERELPGWTVEIRMLPTAGLVVSVRTGNRYMFSGTVDEARSYMFGLTDACRSRNAVAKSGRTSTAR